MKGLYQVEGISIGWKRVERVGDKGSKVYVWDVF